MTYSGDANFAGSTATDTQIVGPASTTTTVSSSPDPTVFGQTVTFTATVAPVAPGSGTVTGTVVFVIDGGGGGTLTGTVAGGVATVTTSTLDAGTHNVTATYSGDVNFTGSTGTDTQTVSQSGTTTTVTSFPDPSGVGDAVTIVAFVTPVAPGSGIPTGTVTFTVTDGVTTVTLTATLDGDGVAAVSTPLVTAGSYLITAVYGGDTNFTGSTDTDTHTVTGA